MRVFCKRARWPCQRRIALAGKFYELLLGWRGRTDPEDTLRFYALRLREAGMLKSNPAKIIADAADWRFLNEVRRELGG